MNYYNNQIAWKPYVSNMSIVKEGGLTGSSSIGSSERFYIKYTPQGTNLLTELSSLLEQFNVVIDSNSAVNVPGYAKYTMNGEEVALISKKEISSWNGDDEHGSLNIEFAEGSDKILFNGNTGQRAFINTDEHFTMIGNNITRYPRDTMMCNRFGDEVLEKACLQQLLKFFQAVISIIFICWVQRARQPLMIPCGQILSVYFKM